MEKTFLNIIRSFNANYLIKYHHDKFYIYTVLNYLLIIASVYQLYSNNLKSYTKQSSDNNK